MGYGRGCLKYWLSFQGRIGRAEFWINKFIILAALIFENIAIHGVKKLAGASPLAGILLVLVILAINFVTCWAAIANNTKRLHDLDRSGWFFLIILIPLVGAVILFGFEGFTRGTIGSNRFGEDPLARDRH